MKPPIVRLEKPADSAAIRRVTERAFRGQPYSSNTEASIIEALRACDALTVSLVAEDDDDRIVGHIAFSPAIPSDAASGWYTLGPLSVDPDVQRRGIGSRLVTDGIAALRRRNASGCIVVGDPDYYLRFGFQLAPDVAADNCPREYFMVMVLDGSAPQSAIDFHRVFREYDH
ncbi:MAG TPA: N-acetyltransferase [Vicinamibacterales bacterium]|nr:N-acetyltransferase [Vicinamibacterales bacterium]